jgi:hypothetical protein
MLESFTRDTFVPHLNGRFQLQTAAAVVDVQLVELTDLSARSSAPPSGDKPRRSPFSAVFLGPRDPILPQQTYRMSHERIGSFDLFIVPIGRDQAGTRYEAIFT